MNKIRCVFLGFCLLITNFAYSDTYQGWYYDVYFYNTGGDRGVHILGLTEARDNLHIPDYINNIPVRGINDYIFSADKAYWKYIKSAKRASIPSSILSMGEGVYKNNTAIEIVEGFADINIPNYTFYGCTSLGAILWMGHIETIGNYAFYECKNLRSIGMLPLSDITSYGDWSFFNTGLEEFKFGEQTTHIGEFAFSYITKPKILTLPNSLKTIGRDAFSACYGLSLVSLGDGEAAVGAFAFQNCTNLKHLVIGKALKSIGNWAFEGCSNLQEIYISDPTPPECPYKVFPDDVKKNATLYVPMGSFADYWSAPEWEDFNIVEKNFEPILSININDSIDIVKDTRVRLPYTITPSTASIPNLAFEVYNGTSIVELSADGFILGKAAGTATIKITSQDGTHIVKYCKITVKEPTITEFKLNTKSLTLQVNEQANLNVTIQPDNTNKTVVWSSDNNEIAVVKEKEGNAIVLARSVGEANIIVQSVEYPEISDTCHVLVVEDNRLVGDVNEDGLVDKTDADTLMDMLLNRIEKSESADVNKDGMVNGIDFVILTKKIR